jgi:hypothetical protein
MQRLTVRVATALGFAAALVAAPGVAWADATVFATTAVPGGSAVIDVGCGADATSASVSGTSWGGPSEIPLDPDTMGGPGAFQVTVTVPASTLPGTYELSATCDDGEAGLGELVVGPHGAPQGGGGGMAAGPNLVLVAAGTAVALASAAGALALRRRTIRG